MTLYRIHVSIVAHYPDGAEFFVQQTVPQVEYTDIETARSAMEAACKAIEVTKYQTS